jgi:hypothetical protein
LDLRKREKLRVREGEKRCGSTIEKKACGIKGARKNEITTFEVKKIERKFRV